MNDSATLRIISKLWCYLAVFLYWASVGIAFTREGLVNNTVSIVSNYIQLLLNALALSAATVNPIWKYRSYSEIISCFNNIDRQLQDIQSVKDTRKSSAKCLNGITAGLFCLLIYNSAFNLYVSVIKYSTPAPYWILCSVPLFIYATSLHQTIFFIFCIHKRLEVIGELFKPQKSVGRGNSDLILILEISPGAKSPGLSREKGSSSQLFRVIDDIYLLSKKINGYFGPVFLSALGALFTVTSVQSFHGLITASDLDEKKNRSIWTLICCINLIVINFVLVFALCWACEKVSEDVDGILSSVIHKQQKEKSFFNEFFWLQPLLSRIKFSAMGCFTINYNMLFGFTTAIVTYLIILVQFNSQSKDPSANTIVLGKPSISPFSYIASQNT